MGIEFPVVLLSPIAVVTYDLTPVCRPGNGALLSDVSAIVSCLTTRLVPGLLTRLLRVVMRHSIPLFCGYTHR